MNKKTALENLLYESRLTQIKLTKKERISSIIRKALIPYVF